MNSSENLSIIQKIRLKMFLSQGYSREKYLKEPEFIKTNEQVIKELIKIEIKNIKDDSFARDILFSFFSDNPNIFDEEEKKQLLLCGLEAGDREIVQYVVNNKEEYMQLISLLSSEVQVKMFNSSGILDIEEIMKYFSYQTVLKIINNNWEIAKSYLPYCNIDVQIEIALNNLDLLKYTSEDAQKKFIEKHEEIIDKTPELLSDLSENIQRQIINKNPLSFIEKINYIKNISREEKQRLFASYIDYIEISKRGKKINIENINFRKAFISDLITYDKEYNIPLNLPLFKDDYGLNINMSIKPITTKKAELYFKKLQNILGSNYKLNFYTSSFNNQTEDFTFKIDNDIEKVVRAFILKDKYKENDFKVGIITIDLSDIKDKKGNQFYKDFFTKLQNIINTNELSYS